ncbi:DinB family protein [Streptomyces collinus]|uniref:DinB family protein n=1 Tax=Streptomyces collinus TaxID=42684 RepID=UPI003318A3A8
MTTSAADGAAGDTTDEKHILHTSLDRHRDAVLWKLEGLDDEQLRRPLTPSGTTLLGLVKHLGSVEYGWFVETFGREAEPLWFDPYQDEDMRVAPGETTERIVAFYGRARAAADRTITELSLDAQGRPPWRDRSVSLRWTLVHMIEETARHAGHMDILRELIDGATGDHRPAGDPVTGQVTD